MSTPVETLIQSLTLDAKLDFFEVDLSPVTGTNTPDDHFYFHAGTNGLRQSVIWQGITYNYLPAEAKGFDIVTKGTMPRPKITISNLNSVGTALLEAGGGDITGARVVRRQTFARYLDAANYPPQVSMFTNTENPDLWTKANVTVTLNSDQDARKDMKASRVYETATANVTHQVSQTTSADLAVGKKVTSWVEVKKGVGTPRVQLAYGGSGGATGNATFDFDSGKFTSIGAVDYYHCAPIGDPQDGWWLLMTVSSIPTLGNLVRRVRLVDANGLSTYTGNPSNYILMGRSNTFSGVVQQNPQDLKNLPQILPYQYIGTAYNPAPDADPDRHFEDEVFFVERKVNEDDIGVEFELSSITDFEGIQLPRGRIIVGYCGHDEYRGEGCMYAGTAYFNAEDEPVSDVAQDVCSRSVTGCKRRFGDNSPLPFGGFPAARTYKL